MKITQICKNSPISQNSGVVNTFLEISLEGYKAQNKEFVKRVFEKNSCLPEAQNVSVVNSLLNISYDFSKKEVGGS